jgi:hypothetical protein
VPPGTAVGYFVKLRELERAGGEAAARKEGAEVKVEMNSKPVASLDRVTQWLETLDMDDN